ncbi:DUF262 domain-containing protein [Pseudomonas syringae]|uniref:DUF262 domain-containing protein n=2 Tax=Pseudomonas syringae TaxID=317 RepID=A0A3M3MEN5_PSESX|nr:DUF262 domain-containing protein [Pseudomonas syringae]KWS40540.1 hypothetical protein AL059_22700 [Pseudomonas syringae pv. papulans]MDH4606863.1 DUF262 domain-containing protein [Pseudomonas syringae pv. papulans]MDH4621426.1 DUF262 domain-containing protein [Pseudomonas syringae pv. papulans]RMN45875.1 hypothetical protein ALQ60_200268 [Pseudomonas syringae pv. papulans]
MALNKSVDDAQALDKQIDIERNNLRTDKIDLSYGELASMFEKQELIINPEYQRLFRWTDHQVTSFIESLLLGFPVPAIFVAETDDGVWELVDGLQRVSSVFGFMKVRRASDGALAAPDAADSLSFSSKKGSRIPLLEGFSYEELSLRSKLTLKRTYCRVEVIRVGSAPNMKYEVFERLNTGGSKLEPQEIRNAIFRAVNPEFVGFCDMLTELQDFQSTLVLSDYQTQSMFDKGLVLRFLTLKNNYQNFDHDVEPFITSYIKSVISDEIAFDMKAEEDLFKRTFSAINNAYGENAFKHEKTGVPKGAFSVYIFDAISIGVAANIDEIEQAGPNDLKARCQRLKQSQDFLLNTGSGANTREKMAARISTAIRILAEKP